jgi:ABC-type transport system involved in Fe-S cluster assembly fused permease/ATPase subunit
MKGRTTFLIAHRLSTLHNCDVLVVIEDGQLVTTTSDVATTIEEALAAGGLDAVIDKEHAHAQAEKKPD